MAVTWESWDAWEPGDSGLGAVGVGEVGLQLLEQRELTQTYEQAATELNAVGSWGSWHAHAEETTSWFDPTEEAKTTYTQPPTPALFERPSLSGEDTDDSYVKIAAELTTDQLVAKSIIVQMNRFTVLLCLSVRQPNRSRSLVKNGNASDTCDSCDEILCTLTRKLAPLPWRSSTYSILTHSSSSSAGFAPPDQRTLAARFPALLFAGLDDAGFRLVATGASPLLPSPPAR